VLPDLRCSCAASAARIELSSLQTALYNQPHAALRARKNTEKKIRQHADELSAMLYPEKDLQERSIGGIYFLLKHGMGLLPRLKESLGTSCVGHQV